MKKLQLENNRWLDHFTTATLVISNEGLMAIMAYFYSEIWINMKDIEGSRKKLADLIQAR